MHLLLLGICFLFAQGLQPDRYQDRFQELQPLKQNDLTTFPNINWMEQNWDKLSNKTLQQITLPGTHDSGSYALTDDLSGIPEWLEEMIKVADYLDLPVGEIIDGWAQSQRIDFYSQFSFGIRYVDVRIIYDPVQGIWRTHHGVVMGNPLDVLLNDTARFIKQHPKEFIILELSHDDGGTNPEVNQLTDMIYNRLGQKMWSPKKGFVPLQEMVDQGFNVLLTLSLGYVPNQWNPNTIINTYANSDKLDTMEAYNNLQVKNFNDEIKGHIPHQLFKMSWTLTPNVDTILEMIIPGFPHTLLELADIAAPALPSWFSSISKSYPDYPILGNILIIDDCTNTKIIDVVTQGF